VKGSGEVRDLGGLCGVCIHAKMNRTRRGPTYLRCLRAAWDERLVRYPTLPVLGCPGFVGAGERPSAAPEPPRPSRQDGRIPAQGAVDSCANRG